MSSTLHPAGSSLFPRSIGEEASFRQLLSNVSEVVNFASVSPKKGSWRRIWRTDTAPLTSMGGRDLFTFPVARARAGLRFSDLAPFLKPSSYPAARRIDACLFVPSCFFCSIPFGIIVCGIVRSGQRRMAPQWRSSSSDF